MASVMSAIKNTVSISGFNRGQVGTAFEEVKETGAKVVIENNAAECVLLSPDEYACLMDEINDARLLTLASNRLDHYDPMTLINFDDANRELGISEADLEDFDEVEFECELFSDSSDDEYSKASEYNLISENKGKQEETI